MRTAIAPRFDARRDQTLLAVGWATFVVVGLLLMDVLDSLAYGLGVLALGIVALLVCLGSDRASATLRWTAWTMDRRDLAVIGLMYATVVGLLSLAFRVFTTERTLWMFLSFAAALLVGVASPVIYTVSLRRRSVQSLGLSLTGWRRFVGPAVVFAGVQFAITLWGYDLPQPVDWVPLLVMALTVGVFESIFFRGFIQGRLEASFRDSPRSRRRGIPLLRLPRGLRHGSPGHGLPLRSRHRVRDRIPDREQRAHALAPAYASRELLRSAGVGRARWGAPVGSDPGVRRRVRPDGDCLVARTSS